MRKTMTICDICGKQDIKINNSMKVKIYNYDWINCETIGSHYYKIDICPDCAEKMKAWIRMNKRKERLKE